MRITTMVVSVLVLILITTSLLFYVSSDRTSDLSDESLHLAKMIAGENRIQGLLIHELDDQLNLLYLISYEPITDRISWIYFDPETVLLSPTFARSISLSELYSNLPPQDLMTELEDILDFEIKYWIVSEDDILTTTVDLLGGIHIQPGQPISQDFSDAEPNYTRWLDGDLALQFATEAYDDYDILGLRFRHKKILMGFVRMLREKTGFLDSNEPLELIYNRLNTNLSFRDFKTALSLLPKFKEEKIKLLPAQATDHVRQQRELDPHRINTMLPPPVKHLIETGEERELIRIQILNGTSISGLAGTLRDKIQSHSFVDVVETDNADRSNYKNTVIIDRSGHPRSAHRIQELIGTGKIEMDLEEHLLVDVTIIAGEDLKHIVE